MHNPQRIFAQVQQSGVFWFVYNYYKYTLNSSCFVNVKQTITVCIPENCFDLFFFKLRDRNKNNPDKPWITSLNEMRLEKIQEMCDKNGAQEMMLHFMELYDRFLEIAESRNEIGMMPAFVGQVPYILLQELL